MGTNGLDDREDARRTTLPYPVRARGHTGCPPLCDGEWLTLIWGQALARRSIRVVEPFITARTVVDELDQAGTRRGREAVADIVARGGVSCACDPRRMRLRYRLAMAHLAEATDYPCVVVESASRWLAVHILTATVFWPPVIGTIYVVRSPPPGLELTILGPCELH